VNEANKQLCHVIYEQRNQLCPDLVVTLDGDHSIAIGSVAATSHFYPDLCVVWVNAHADINTPMKIMSGNMHGMPLAFLCNIDSCVANTSEFEWLTHVHSPKEEIGGTSACLSTPRITYIGLLM
jgi:arginase